MSDTASDHPLIRDYLRKLTEALASLPSERAAELRDQIAAHLAEELRPGATDDDVADAIRRLGAPADLAREAGVRRTPGSVIRRRSWRFWTSTGVVLAAATALIGLLVSVENATALTFEGSAGWWYPQDWKHEVDTSADGLRQATVPMRWRQQQGFFVQIYNFSGYTQTVLGFAGYAVSPGNAEHAQLTLSATDGSHNPAAPHALRFTLPVSIPPGQSRDLRLLWTNDDCLQVGGTAGIDQLNLRVRVGWITRTEVISLGQAWAVEGTAQSSCAPR
jgi:hypothetical protein